MEGKKSSGKEAETGKQDERAARRRGRGGEPVSGVIGEFPRDHDLPVLPLETATESGGGRGGGERGGERVSLHAKKKARKKE